MYDIIQILFFKKKCNNKKKEKITNYSITINKRMREKEERKRDKYVFTHIYILYYIILYCKRESVVGSPPPCHQPYTFAKEKQWYSSYEKETRK